MANERFKGFLTEGMLALSHGNSIWDMVTGLFGKKAAGAAETAVGGFGKGYGDEHQLETLHSELKPKVLARWGWFINKNYKGHTGLRAIKAERKLKELRLFITSWDQKVSIGEKKTTVTSGAKDAEQKKIEEVKQIFSVKTNHAKDWIISVVKMIETAPNEEEGYLKVLSYFDLTQLPRMPAPGEKDYIDTIEDWQKRILGANPTEGIKQHINNYAQKIEEKPKGFLYRIMSRFNPF